MISAEVLTLIMGVLYCRYGSKTSKIVKQVDQYMKCDGSVEVKQLKWYAIL